MSLSILGRQDRLAHLLPEAKELRITGFQSPAEDETEDRLSLDSLTGLGAAHIWVVAVTDDSLIGFGLYPGDHLVVDRGYTLIIGDSRQFRARLVVVDLGDGGGYRVRMMMTDEELGLVLRAPNRFTRDVRLDYEEGVEVWGTITWIIGRVG